MRYLITGIENGLPFAFYTNWYDDTNCFNNSLNMRVVDLHNGLYTFDGIIWESIQEDHL